MCKKVFGYCRISRKEQNIDRQERNISAAYPDAFIIREAYTGTTVKGRKEFEKLMNVVQAGDTIVFDSVSRMSRNAAEGFELYQELFTKGVNLVFLKESYIDTDTYKQALDRQLSMVATGNEATDELMNSILAALNRYMMKLAEQQIQIAFNQAEKEVADLHKRTSEGMLTAKLNGKQIGQVQGAKLETKKAKAVKPIIAKRSRKFGGDLNDTDLMKITGLSRNTFYKYVRELSEKA